MSDPLIMPHNEGKSKLKKRPEETAASNGAQAESTLGSDKKNDFGKITLEVDLIAVALLLLAAVSRFSQLSQPHNVVFDEMHYGKIISNYVRNVFYFDSQPPLGKQIVAFFASAAGFNGSFKFDRIGLPYPEEVPLVALRFFPALCGSLLVPTAYAVMLEMRFSRWTALLSALLLLWDNALLVQSRFLLMESMLVFFSLLGLVCVLKFRASEPYAAKWWLWLVLAAGAFGCALSVKYSGVYSFMLGATILLGATWSELGERSASGAALALLSFLKFSVFLLVPVAVYVSVFRLHLSTLTKAGPHDNIMTSAFQASLEGGLASITKGQPLVVAHGSQITLRHSHGRTCWLHSHQHVYPLRYPDKRGSSHQQQVTCYSFKDVNNWWIVKRPGKPDLAVEQPVDAIRHGDVVQLVHGITSRSLNSHDVSAPMSPSKQEVSCYIDYNISMPAQNLWRVDITNRDQSADTWHTIQSLVRLVHVASGQALKFSGKQLPDWGFNQHEVVTDRIIHQEDTVWNVEEHRYTKTDDQKERERQLVSAEMIPLGKTKLSFWEKFLELQYKMLTAESSSVSNHMYSSEPKEWPLMARGIAYWVSSDSNAQVYLLGNIVVWYSSALGVLVYSCLLVFYSVRRRRQCFDVDQSEWDRFKQTGQVLFAGYFLHFLPYFFAERTLFLYHYLPAFVFTVLLTAAVAEHVYVALCSLIKPAYLNGFFISLAALWLLMAYNAYHKFLVLCCGSVPLSGHDVKELRWRSSWDFIVHKN